MAGTVIADFLQPQSNTGLFILSPTGSTMATINSAGMFSNTGVLMVTPNGALGNLTATAIGTSAIQATNGNTVMSISSTNTATIGIGTTPADSQAYGGPIIDMAANSTIGTGTATYYRNLNGNTYGFVGYYGSSLTLGTTGNNLLFSTGNTERVRVDSSGNVGIGTASPANRLDVSVTGADVAVRAVTTSANYATFRLKNSSQDYSMQIRTDQSNAWTLRDETAGANRLLVDTSGNLLVQTTSASFNSGVGMKMIPDASGPAIVCVGTATSASFNSYFIYSTGAGANRFYVSYAGQIYATSTGITAISDVTLKENIRDLETGLDEIMALRPRRFDWKEETKLDQKNVAGFIAQEVEPVLPDLVYDYKYNEETTKKAVKTSDMLPTLVKAIQELKAINDTQAETINALTARVVALEAK
jgi:hypothetical protein